MEVLSSVADAIETVKSLFVCFVCVFVYLFVCLFVCCYSGCSVV